MHIKYTGTADFKSFTAADLKKGGVEDEKKITFIPDEIIEVSDALGEALTAPDGLFATDPFEVVEPEDVPEAEAKAEANDEQDEVHWVERVEGDADARTKDSSSDANVTAADANVTAAEAKSTTTKAPRSSKNS
jgi:hypothetical protein